MELSEGVSESPVLTKLLEAAKELGMVETADMMNLREEIVEALQDSTQEDRARELYGQYEAHLDVLLRTATSLRGQIGEQILKAAIFHSAGRDLMYRDFMLDAIQDAHNSGFMWGTVNLLQGILRTGE